MLGRYSSSFSSRSFLGRNFSDQPPAVELLRARGPPKAEGRVNWGPSDSHLQVRVSEKRAP